MQGVRIRVCVIKIYMTRPTHLCANNPFRSCLPSTNITFVIKKHFANLRWTFHVRQCIPYVHIYHLVETAFAHRKNSRDPSGRTNNSYTPYCMPINMGRKKAARRGPYIRPSSDHDIINEKAEKGRAESVRPKSLAYIRLPPERISTGFQ